MRILLTIALAALGVQADAAQKPERIIIGFNPTADAAKRADVLKRNGLSKVDEIQGLNIQVAEAKPGRITPNAFRLMADPAVVYAEKDFYTTWLVNAAPISFGAAPLPSVGAVLGKVGKFEPKGATQGEQPWGIRKVNAQAAWSRTKGRGVRVAVIDTGVDCSHRDLAPNCVSGYNAFDDSKPAHDDQGHGTHVAGTIAAVEDGWGVVGVAPEATIVPVKVLNKDGGGNLSSIIKGLMWVAKNDIDVANMSLGSPMGSVFMRMAVAYAKSKGVAIVAATGNDGNDVGYPAAYASTFAFWASNEKGGIAGFSSRGKEVDFIAPGVGVESTIPGGGHTRHSGTSMATPHMAGLAALAVAQGASGYDGVKSALERAAKPMQGLQSTEQGYGLVDAADLYGR